MSEKTRPGADEVLDNFCLMLFEEFLVKKNMRSTLDAFRSEWQTSHQRPAEDTLLFSWYDVALRLRLPELVASVGGAESSTAQQRPVIENLVRALVKESAIKNRRSEDVTVTGLAAMPRRTALPPMTTTAAQGLSEDIERGSPSPPPSLSKSPRTKSAPGAGSTNNNNNTRSTADLERRLKTTKRAQESAANRSKQHTSESWIPEDARMRQFHRQLQIVKEVFHDTKVLEDSQNRELKRLMVSDLERAKSEEQLDATKKIACGCCTQMFLKVNLPMKVSRKAIQDIRQKWRGNLNSSTVFRGNSTRELTGNIDRSGKKTHSSDEDITVAGAFPSCYDEVGVCRFCAQFFAEPDDYRPSYATITFNERKTAHFEQKRREREYWDPLKMLEKDRLKQEEYEKTVELESASGVVSMQLSSAQSSI